MRLTSKILFIGLTLIVIFISGCSKEENQNIIQEKQVADPVIQRAEPYISKIVFEDINTRSKAGSIASSCPSGDKECQVNSIYRYVIENYNYYSDPRSREFIQSPSETISVKGGDCEDLTILLNSLLENLGIKTYIVLTEDHAYSLACGINPDDLWQYIQQDIVNQFSKDMGKTEDYKVVVENGNLFLVTEKKETFVLGAGYNYYYGGDGSKFTSPIDFMNIKYDIASSQPLTIYVVPTKNDFELLNKGDTFTNYPSCKKQNVLKTTESCDNLYDNGGLILVNNNLHDTTINLNIDFYYLYSAFELIKDQKISYYQIGDQQCVVLDSTAGKYGYPGYDANLIGEKIAIDPITREYVYLK